MTGEWAGGRLEVEGGRKNFQFKPVRWLMAIFLLSNKVSVLKKVKLVNSHMHFIPAEHGIGIIGRLSTQIEYLSSSRTHKTATFSFTTFTSNYLDTNKMKFTITLPLFCLWFAAAGPAAADVAALRKLDKASKIEDDAASLNRRVQEDVEVEDVAVAPGMKVKETESCASEYFNVGLQQAFASMEVAQIRAHKRMKKVRARNAAHSFMCPGSDGLVDVLRRTWFPWSWALVWIWICNWSFRS